MLKDAWNPGQYEKFWDEREAPGVDLSAGIERGEFWRGIDLGCGTGELTARVQRELGVREMVGVDSSEAMLSKARMLEREGLSFERLGIEEFGIGTYGGEGEYDLIFSNAAIQWCGDHAGVIGRCFRALRKGGQLAIQMPANHGYPTHVIADQLGREEPFWSALGGVTRETTVRSPEWYAGQLYETGFPEQRVMLRVYGHVLESREGVIEWVKGTLLTWYESRLPGELYQEFLVRFRERLFGELADSKPFFYPFQRVFLWGRK